MSSQLPPPAPVAAGPFAPLRIGPLTVDPPVVLAPMAGITNSSFRRLCREQGAGLYVSEMITARALVERNAETMRMIGFDADERPRSLQLYAVDAATVDRAVRMLVDEDRADHIDFNFGCPVPKVTRKGGGAALPWKRDLFRAIVRAAVRAADGRVPVTVKMRIGIDPEHLTYLDAGHIAEDEGVSAIALHARTAAQAYSGEADWSAISRLKEHVTTIPVLGNGDIWSAADAARMMHETGCDGVVVGRGCLGRPQLFGALAALLGRGESDLSAERPPMGDVLRTMYRHAELLSAELGTQPARSGEGTIDRGVRDFRKHVAWYLKGFSVGSSVRDQLAKVGTLAELDELLGQIDADQHFPAVAIGTPRGRTGNSRRVVLPEGWLESRDGCVGVDDEGSDALGGG